ncbi:MAG: ribbon-helix-helix domain-containing protein [Spirochaetaceae bacterium]|jgi:Arc/MetJ-type ribon-helix-helix transcriptional regulator|nr:ribbon-helix-helix domain-containing protein [Spirochaetaceae bacterium]
MNNDLVYLGIKLPLELVSQIESFCRENKIKSKSEFVRRAIKNYIYPDIKDETLRMISLKDMQVKTQRIIDMIQVLFTFQTTMYKNTLLYHSEIPQDMKDVAAMSAKDRYTKFYKAFEKSLAEDDASFFERILHQFYSGDDNGQN